MQLKELSNYNGSLLNISAFRDYCPNGLQVEGRPEVLRIATGVSASLKMLEMATEWGADAVIVHHGYFWRNEDANILGIKKRRIAHLLKHNVSLLAYHLPLDAHPELGNNAQLAKLLGWQKNGHFAEQEIASYGVPQEQQALSQLALQLETKLGRVPQVIGDLSKTINSIAWCTGGAQSYFEQAIAMGVDAFVTGEISEPNVHVARETGVSFISAGHHATERYGVQALGEHLAERFTLEHCFFDDVNPV